MCFDRLYDFEGIGIQQVYTSRRGSATNESVASHHCHVIVAGQLTMLADSSFLRPQVSHFTDDLSPIDIDCQHIPLYSAD